MTWNPLAWVIQALKESGASGSELRIARERGQQIVKQYPTNTNSEIQFTVLRDLQDTFGIGVDETRPQITPEIKRLLTEVKGEKLKRELASKWWRGGRERDGD